MGREREYVRRVLQRGRKESGKVKSEAKIKKEGGRRRVKRREETGTVCT